MGILTFTVGYPKIVSGFNRINQYTNPIASEEKIKENLKEQSEEIRKLNEILKNEFAYSDMSDISQELEDISQELLAYGKSAGNSQANVGINSANTQYVDGQMGASAVPPSIISEISIAENAPESLTDNVVNEAEMKRLMASFSSPSPAYQNEPAAAQNGLSDVNEEEINRQLADSLNKIKQISAKLIAKDYTDKVDDNYKRMIATNYTASSSSANDKKIGANNKLRTSINGLLKISKKMQKAKLPKQYQGIKQKILARAEQIEQLAKKLAQLEKSKQPNDKPSNKKENNNKKAEQEKQDNKSKSQIQTVSNEIYKAVRELYGLDAMLKQGRGRQLARSSGESGSAGNAEIISGNKSRPNSPDKEEKPKIRIGGESNPHYHKMVTNISLTNTNTNDSYDSNQDRAAIIANGYNKGASPMPDKVKLGSGNRDVPVGGRQQKGSFKQNITGEQPQNITSPKNSGQSRKPSINQANIPKSEQVNYDLAQNNNTAKNANGSGTGREGRADQNFNNKINSYTANKKNAGNMQNPNDLYRNLADQLDIASRYLRQINNSGANNTGNNDNRKNQLEKKLESESALFKYLGNKLGQGSAKLYRQNRDRADNNYNEQIGTDNNNGKSSLDYLSDRQNQLNDPSGDYPQDRYMADLGLRLGEISQNLLELSHITNNFKYLDVSSRQYAKNNQDKNKLLTETKKQLQDLSAKLNQTGNNTNTGNKMQNNNKSALNNPSSNDNPNYISPEVPAWPISDYDLGNLAANNIPQGNHNQNQNNETGDNYTGSHNMALGLDANKLSAMDKNEYRDSSQNNQTGNNYNQKKSNYDYNTNQLNSKNVNYKKANGQNLGNQLELLAKSLAELADKKQKSNAAKEKKEYGKQIDKNNIQFSGTEKTQLNYFKKQLKDISKKLNKKNRQAGQNQPQDKRLTKDREKLIGELAKVSANLNKVENEKAEKNKTQQRMQASLSKPSSQLAANQAENENRNKNQANQDLAANKDNNQDKYNLLNESAAKLKQIADKLKDDELALITASTGMQTKKTDSRKNSNNPKKNLQYSQMTKKEQQNKENVYPAPKSTDKYNQSQSLMQKRTLTNKKYKKERREDNPSDWADQLKRLADKLKELTLDKNERRILAKRKQQKQDKTNSKPDNDQLQNDKSNNRNNNDHNDININPNEEIRDIAELTQELNKLDRAIKDKALQKNNNKKLTQSLEDDIKQIKKIKKRLKSNPVNSKLDKDLKQLIHQLSMLKSSVSSNSSKLKGGAFPTSLPKATPSLQKPPKSSAKLNNKSNKESRNNEDQYKNKDKDKKKETTNREKQNSALGQNLGSNSQKQSALIKLDDIINQLGLAKKDYLKALSDKQLSRSTKNGQLDQKGQGAKSQRKPKSDTIKSPYPMQEDLTRQEIFERIILRLKTTRQKISQLPSPPSYSPISKPHDKLRHKVRKITQPKNLPELRQLTKYEINRPIIRKSPPRKKSELPKNTLISFQDKKKKTPYAQVSSRAKITHKDSSLSRVKPSIVLPAKGELALSAEQAPDNSVRRQHIPNAYLEIFHKIYER